MDSQTPQPRHIQMRRQYDLNRYARHLSQAELNRRIRDVLLNLLILTSEAKIGLNVAGDQGIIWMEKWTHVLEEMQLRYGPYPAGFSRDILHSEPFPDLVSTIAKKAANAFKIGVHEPASLLIKYGKRPLIERLFYEGSLRIQPASYFTRNDLNGAIRDDERRLPMSFALSREEIRKIVRNPQDVPETAPDQRVDIVLQSGPDYWIYCLTESIEPRLFIDFDADACLIIRDRRQFAERLRTAVSTVLGEFSHQARAVDYVDPLLPKTTQIFLPFAKHFGYTYQSEYRFCWFPLSPVVELPYRDVSIGSLQDIADLIVL